MTSFDDLPFAKDYPADPPVTTPRPTPATSGDVGPMGGDGANPIPPSLDPLAMEARVAENKAEIERGMSRDIIADFDAIPDPAKPVQQQEFTPDGIDFDAGAPSGIGDRFAQYGAESYPDISGVQRGIPEYPGQGTFGDLGGGWVPDPVGFKKALGTSPSAMAQNYADYGSGQVITSGIRDTPVGTVGQFNSPQLGYDTGVSAPRVQGNATNNVTGSDVGNDPRFKDSPIASAVASKIAPSNDQPTNGGDPSPPPPSNWVPDAFSYVDPYEPSQTYQEPSTQVPRAVAPAEPIYNYEPQPVVPPMALSADTSSLTNDEFYNGLTELDWTDPAANGMQYTDAKDAMVNPEDEIGMSLLKGNPANYPVQPTWKNKILNTNPNLPGTKGLLTNIAKAASRGMSVGGPLGAVVGGLFGANTGPRPTFDQAMSMYQNNPNMTQVKNAHNAPSRSGSFSVHTSPGGRTSVVSGKGEYGDGSYTVTSKTSDGGSVKTVRLGEGSANPGGQAATKIVCTAMLNEYGFGSYRQKIWLLYSKRYTGPAHEVGYHAMFLPLIKWAYKDKKEWVRKPLEHVVRLRTVACEDIMKKRKRWHVGHLYNTVFCAACYTLGKVITMVKKDKQPCQA